MTDGIFLVQGGVNGGELTAMQSTPFAKEDVFQALIERYPDILAGNQIDPGNPRRWLLVRRESPIPNVEAGPGYWSLDHLFLDQDGIPTLVEVKRASDGRLRREVVAQMLDYAANASTLWPKGEIERQFFAAPSSDGAPEARIRLAEFLGEELPETFWAQVETNLRARRIRLLFVADMISPELRRIVEFLNETMDPVEVLAIEIRHYVGGPDVRALVPRVIGQSEMARVVKGPRPVVWTFEAFEDQVRRLPQATRDVVLRITQHAKQAKTHWGRSSTAGILNIEPPAKHCVMLTVQADSTVGIVTKYILETRAFLGAPERADLFERMNSIPGIRIDPQDLPKLGIWPKLISLPTQDAQQKLAELAIWIIDRVYSERSVSAD